MSAAETEAGRDGAVQVEVDVDGDGGKRVAEDEVESSGVGGERSPKRARSEHPSNLLTYLLKGRWLGTTMLIDVESGQVRDRYLTVSSHGIDQNRFSRLTQRVYPDGRIESSFFPGHFENNYNTAVCTTSATVWKMKEVCEDMVIITSLADIDALPANSLLADSLITRQSEGVYIHTRQIMVCNPAAGNNSVHIESTRTRRISGENIFLAHPDEAPPLDTQLLKPHLDQLRALELQAKAQLAELGGTDTPDDQSLAGD